jgi:hypothetical protein
LSNAFLAKKSNKNYSIFLFFKNININRFAK